MKPLDVDPNELAMIEAGEEEDSYTRAIKALDRKAEKELKEHDRYDSDNDR